MNIKKFAVVVILTALSFCTAFADVTLPPIPYSNLSDFTFLPYEPSLNVWGYEGSRGLGEGDALIPVAGNADNAMSVDLQTAYATDDSRLISGGLSYRHIYEDQRILGAYVFADSNRSGQQQTFWFVSPGIESLGNIWDFRLNGYFPVTSQNKFVGFAFADTLGIYNNVQFSGHTQFDSLINISNEVGTGADLEIGHIIPFLNNSRIYLGGYYFKPQNVTSIKGGETRIEYPVNRYINLEAADTYDNTFHNRAEIGVRLTLGGINPDQAATPIQARLLTPIRRNLSTIASGSGVPVVTSYRNLGDHFIERNNIFFFSPDGVPYDPALGAANCTFESPCASTSFTQATINSIDTFTDYSYFYLAPTTYNIVGQLTLNDNQNVFGRTPNFVAPAPVGSQPIINSLGFILLGNNTLDSLTLFNNGSGGIGINATNASNITISNVLMGGSGDDPVNYLVPISLTNAHDVEIINSTLFASPQGMLSTPIVISATNSDFNVDNSTLTAFGGAGPTGVSLNNSTGVISNSTITSSDALNFFGASAFGVTENNGSNLTINSSRITVTSTADANSAFAAGISVNNSVLNVNDSIIEASANVSGNAALFGAITAFATGITGSNNTINSQNTTYDISAISQDTDGLVGNDAFATGISANSSNVTAIGNEFNVFAQTLTTPTGVTSATGIEMTGGTLTQASNIFNVTAVCSTAICLENDITGP